MEYLRANNEVTITKSEYEERIEGLRRAMKDCGINAAILFDSRDVYYYAGTGVYSSLVIPLEREPILLVQINSERGRRESWVGDVRDSIGFKTVKELWKELDIASSIVGVEKDILPVNYFENMANAVPSTKFVDISPLILRQRSIKTKKEIELIKRAAEISNNSLEAIKRILKFGMTEIELEIEIEAIKRKMGHERMWERTWPRRGNSANGIVSGSNLSIISGYWIAMEGSGPSRSMPYGASNKRIHKGDLVDINHGTVYQGYHSDEARMFIVGKVNKKQSKLYDIVLEALNITIESIRPGIKASDIYKVAKRKVDDFGYSEFFMGYNQYSIEYVGHGVGLEINEFPFIGPKNNEMLKPGMVFALEPKLIFPGVTGIDLEDTIAVTEEGFEVLTLTPKDKIIEC